MTVHKFTFIVEGEVGMIAQCSDEMYPLACEALVACLRSNPVIVEVPEDHPRFNEIREGWFFDGQEWGPTETEQPHSEPILGTIPEN